MTYIQIFNRWLTQRSADAIADPAERDRFYKDWIDALYQSEETLLQAVDELECKIEDLESPDSDCDCEDAELNDIMVELRNQRRILSQQSIAIQNLTKNSPKVKGWIDE